MINIKVAILDDKKIHIKKIEKLIREYNGKCEFEIYSYTTSKEFLNSKYEFDIAFIDVELEGEKEGLITAKQCKFNHEKTKIIFVSSHEELVREGFKFEGFRYVYKSELKKDLTDALDAAFESIMENETIELSFLDKGRYSLKIRDIDYFETYGNNVLVHYVNEKEIIREKISEIYEMLKTKGFERSHKSYVVNINKVVTIYDDDMILMKNKDKIRLSRTYKHQFKDKFWQLQIEGKKKG